MTLEEIAIAAHDAAKDTKEQKLKDSTSPEPESVELLSMLDGYRDGESVVHALLFEANFEAIMQAVKVLASGFGCDAIVLVNESFHANTDTNPMTKSRWRPGDMQELARNHDGVRQGWIHESLGTMAVNRAGDIVHVLTDFKAYSEETPAEGIVSWTLEWGERKVINSVLDDAQLSGRFPETMVRLMNEPTLLQEALKAGMGPAEFGLDTSPEGQELTLAHMDCAVVKAVSGMGLISAALMLQAPKDSLRAQVMEESLGSLPNVMTPEQMQERYVRDPDGPPA